MMKYGWNDGSIDGWLVDCILRDREKHRNVDYISYRKKSSGAFEKLSDTITKEYSEKKEDNRMVYHVKFEGTDKLYAYYCAPYISLQLGQIYMIQADHITNYKNPVTIVRIDNRVPAGVNIRTITRARLFEGAKRPDDRIDRVIFNKEKLTTVVLWKDGTKTIVKCQPGDMWDEEKALAMCYMKKALGNRGAFNEVIKKYCAEPDYAEQVGAMLISMLSSIDMDTSEDITEEMKRDNEE